MSQPTWEEMEGKRQLMIQSFKEIATAMSRCVAVIEDYTRASPSSIPSKGKAHTTVTGQVHVPLPDTIAAATEESAVTATGKGKSKKEKVVKEKPEKEKKVKEKKIKDPNAPKRPASAYLLYKNESIAATKAKHPDLPYKELLALVGQEWNALDASLKKKYEDQYRESNSAYKAEDAAYKAEQANAAPGTMPPSAMQTQPVPTVPAPVRMLSPSTSASTSDSSEDEDDSSDDTPPPAKVKTPKAATATPAPAPTPAPPATLAAVPATTDSKKEKKRKNKEDEAVVAAQLTPAPAEKKKRAKKVKE